MGCFKSNALALRHSHRSPRNESDSGDSSVHLPGSSLHSARASKNYNLILFRTILHPPDSFVSKNERMAEVCTLWEVLSDEAVSVFVEAAFPRVIRLGKVGFCSQSRDDFGMGGEFFSVVVSNRFDATGEGQKDASAGLHNGVCAVVGELGELGVFGLALDVRHDSALVTRADDRVGFPVADAAFLGDNGGALVDVHAIRDQATA